MFRRVFRAAMCSMAALVAVSATAVPADDDAFYFCTGYPNADTGKNSVLVLKLEPSEITSQGSKFLRCVLPDIEPSTLKDLVTSGQRNMISRSGVIYNSQIEVAGELLPVRVTKGLSTRDRSGSINSSYELAERVCGLEDTDYEGLVLESKNKPECLEKDDFYFGNIPNREIISILCRRNKSNCMISFEYFGWVFSVHVNRDIALTNWRLVIEASEKEITSRTILSLNSKGCFGLPCNEVLE